MTATERAWSGTLEIVPVEPRAADWLAAALAPEAAREVPRASATVDRPVPGRVRIEISAADAGAMRAALNTYLGWVELAGRTATAAHR